MNKFFFFLLSIFVLTSLTSSAAVYKGQREFVKKCVKCHKGGQAFVSTKKKREWKRLMAKKGKNLAQIHLSSKDKKAKKSIKYFTNRKYKKKVKHLQHFLVEYAKDSGNVPACD
ncbi:cytochrome C [Candidatus Sulfurimonas marisnigri]|uniref:Cytochrome C n=1 Tax=Candidatus Sulfurimonas marisnigri TaxID=2740405 RepID=A0A7S7RRC5_9BACT|nr:cytochrome C [Candidatus Sulfurimonas marisnigri]QOY55589.1 cytochrome C [Candidatus Sulfurimonas marisnigri]